MISVVIPTIGSKHLNKTIDHLFKQTVLPDEVILVVPKQYKKEINIINNKNILIIYTDKKGQVYQRSIGLKNAKYKYVMQLDDDVFLTDRNLISNLIEQLLSVAENSVVAPVIREINKDIFKYGKFKLLMIRLYNYFIRGSRNFYNNFGEISTFGIPCPQINFSEKSNIQTDWLPGGCVMSKKINLVTEDFYPYPGKAYSEDILHSIIRKNNNIKHYLISNLYVETLSDTFNIKTDFYSQYKIRKYICKYISGNVFRFYIWYYLESIKINLKFNVFQYR